MSLNGTQIHTSTCAARKNGDLAYVDGFFLWGPHVPCGSTRRPMSGSRPIINENRDLYKVLKLYATSTPPYCPIQF